MTVAFLTPVTEENQRQDDQSQHLSHSLYCKINIQQTQRGQLKLALDVIVVLSEINDGALGSRGGWASFGGCGSCCLVV